MPSFLLLPRKKPIFTLFPARFSGLFALWCGLVKSENVLGALLIHENARCPFSAIACFFENNYVKPYIRAKVFNLIIKVYSDNQEFERAFEAFVFMISNCIDIDERTCSICLIELMRCDQLELGIEFFYRMLESGIEVSVFSLTVVLDGLCKSGEIKRANIITCNTLVNACAKRWKFDELDKALELMRKGGVNFSVETYKFLIDVFSSSGKIDDSERMVFEMLEKGFKVDAYICNLIINGYCRLGDIKQAFSLLCTMGKRGVCPNSDSYEILISGFCKFGQPDEVKVLVYEMQSKGVKLFYSPYEIVLVGLCKSGQTEESKLLFSTLVKRGLVDYFFKFHAID